jgi:putative membrane protein
MTRAEIGDALALVNALLNATSGALVLTGRRVIARGDREGHKRLMLAAVATSAAFLVSYLTRVGLTGTHRDPHTGLVHLFYLVLLTSHMLLAMAVVPLVLAAVYFAYKGRFATHKKIVRWAYPIWVYVSATGVLVYLVLYHLPP